MTLSVEINPRGVGWVELGTNHRCGVVPQSIVYDSDVQEYGALGASFRVNVARLEQHYDLEHFTPVKIVHSGRCVWAGRIIRPSRRDTDIGEISVQCQGWPQHLKDDATNRVWLQSDMSDWRDAFGHPDLDLTEWPPFAAVTNIGDATIFIQVPTGTTVPTDGQVGAFLDLGPDNSAASIVIEDVEVSSGITAAKAYLTVAVSATISDAPTVITSYDLNTTSHGPLTVTVSPVADNWRYVWLYYRRPVTTTTGVEQWLRIKGVTVSTDTALVSSNVSDLHASTIIGDALTEAAPLLSTDQSLLTATTFDILHFPARLGRNYPNELIASANAYHGYQFLLTNEAQPRPVFRPVPSAPRVLLGGSDDYEFEDVSFNDGSEVFSRVICEYDAAGGERGEAIADTPTGIDLIPVTGHITNATFADAIGAEWTIVGDTAARVTTGEHTATGALAVSDTGGTSSATTAINGLVKGAKYRLEFYAIPNVFSYDTQPQVYTGDASYPVVYTTQLGVSASWEKHTIDFTADLNYMFFKVVGPSTADILYIDTLQLFKRSGNVVERRGFTRTLAVSLSGRHTAASAQPIAQLYLDARQYPPLAGTITTRSPIRLASGGTVAPQHAANLVGEMVLLEEHVHPNTGATGRTGIIARSGFDENTGAARFEIDTPSDYLDNLLARIEG